MNKTMFKGTDVKLIGDIISVGDKAPVVTGTEINLNDEDIGGAKDKIQLILSVPSLDTDTCAAETKRFNQDVDNLDICETTVISMDLPFAAKRFCTAEGIENLTVVSDYYEKAFGNAYGVLMADNKLKGLLARAAFVVDRKGIVVYKEIVPEVTDEPNYDDILNAIKDA